MWQAGIYMRVSEMLLIIVLMFCAGLFLGQALWHDLLLRLAPAVAFGIPADCSTSASAACAG